MVLRWRMTRILSNVILKRFIEEFLISFMVVQILLFTTGLAHFDFERYLVTPSEESYNSVFDVLILPGRIDYQLPLLYTSLQFHFYPCNFTAD